MRFFFIASRFDDVDAKDTTTTSMPPHASSTRILHGERRRRETRVAVPSREASYSLVRATLMASRPIIRKADIITCGRNDADLTFELLRLRAGTLLWREGTGSARSPRPNAAACLGDSEPSFPGGSAQKKTSPLRRQTLRRNGEGSCGRPNPRAHIEGSRVRVFRRREARSAKRGQSRFGVGKTR